MTDPALREQLIVFSKAHREEVARKLGSAADGQSDVRLYGGGNTESAVNEGGQAGDETGAGRRGRRREPPRPRRLRGTESTMRGGGSGDESEDGGLGAMRRPRTETDEDEDDPVVGGVLRKRLERFSEMHRQERQKRFGF
jgi:hypothetical protein